MYYASNIDCDSMKLAGDRCLHDWNTNVNRHQTKEISFNIGRSSEIYNNSLLNFPRLSTADNAKCAQDIPFGEYTNEISSRRMESHGALHCIRTKKTVLNDKMHKQIAHCNIERRRRGLINERMVKLQGLLFPGRTKCKKSDVLKKAIDCISRMKEDYGRISKVEEAVVKLLEENKVLAWQVQMLESLMNSSAYIPSNNMENIHYDGMTSEASTVSKSNRFKKLFKRTAFTRSNSFYGT